MDGEIDKLRADRDRLLELLREWAEPNKRWEVKVEGNPFAIDDLFDRTRAALTVDRN